MLSVRNGDVVVFVIVVVLAVTETFSSFAYLASCDAEYGDARSGTLGRWRHKRTRLFCLAVLPQLVVREQDAPSCALSRVIFMHAPLQLSRNVAAALSVQDMLMMATLISKVQLLRDLRSLQAEAKAEELKKQESLMQSSSKVRI